MESNLLPDVEILTKGAAARFPTCSSCSLCVPPQPFSGTPAGSPLPPSTTLWSPRLSSRRLFNSLQHAHAALLRGRERYLYMRDEAFQPKGERESLFHLCKQRQFWSKTDSFLLVVWLKEISPPEMINISWYLSEERQKQRHNRKHDLTKWLT